MAALQQLTEMGYVVLFSAKSPAPFYNKWFVGIKNATTLRQINGYGEDENLAFENALKTALEIR